MPKHRLPPGIEPEDGYQRLIVFVKVNPNGVRFKFLDGAGIGITRDNPGYYDVIGEWFCAEVEAPAIREKCRHVPEGDYCNACRAIRRGRLPNDDTGKPTKGGTK